MIRGAAGRWEVGARLDDLQSRAQSVGIWCCACAARANSPARASPQLYWPAGCPRALLVGISACIALKANGKTVRRQVEVTLLRCGAGRRRASYALAHHDLP